MLHVVATPIGNLGDISARALECLKSASLIACEDTRRTWQLLTHFGIPRPEMVSYRQGNEERIAEHVVAAVNAGREVALCSDGGDPGISDPGYRLIRKCATENVPYDVIPGASAVNVALLMSGLSTSSFTFKGFPPRGPGAIRNWFAEEKESDHTLICYESPFRVVKCLEQFAEIFGAERKVSVTREISKKFEQTVRGTVAEVAEHFRQNEPKGEFVIVLAGQPKQGKRDEIEER